MDPTKHFLKNWIFGGKLDNLGCRGRPRWVEKSKYFWKRIIYIHSHQSFGVQKIVAWPRFQAGILQPSDWDNENVLIDNFHRFVTDFQTILWILITWLEGHGQISQLSHKMKILKKRKIMGTLSELQDDQVYVYKCIKFIKTPLNFPYKSAGTSLILLYAGGTWNWY